MNSTLFFTKLYEQCILVGLTTLMAIGIGIPLGIASYKASKLKPWIFSFINICQTIPSLALLACLIPLLGIGMKPALLTMTLYAIMPVVVNTFSGLEGIPPEQIEAADGLGFTPLQKLRIVELPLAFPIMIAGMRTAAVMSVGIATIASFIGAGGLGDFIFQGIATNNIQVVLYGAVPAALLALLIDYVFRRIESYCLTSHETIGRSIAKIAAVFLLLMTLVTISQYGKKSAEYPPITVASKNFTEQYILGEMIAQLIEANTPYPVNRKFSLGATDLCHQAMLNGEIDIYPEYTGTAHLLILKEKNINYSPDELFEFVNQNYKDKFNIEWLPPLGFNNTESLAARIDRADDQKWESISDVKENAHQLTLGTFAEFYSRPDGYPVFNEIYGIEFGKVVLLEPSLVYEAALHGEVDLITGFSTSGKLMEYPLVVLEDDKQVFPPYHAAILIRQKLVQSKPEIKEILTQLSGIINEEEIRNLNYQVDVEKKNYADVAHHFLLRHDLL